RVGLAAALPELIRRIRVPVILHGDGQCAPGWVNQFDGYREWKLKVQTNGTATGQPAAALPAPAPHGRFLTLVWPKRDEKDLILPDDLKKQVLQIAAFSEALPKVSGGKWDFARRVTGGNGLKVLFVGEPGTGKTLAAEVIAAKLKLP